MQNNPTSAKITALSHDSRGIAQINGKTIFIEGALPGEEVLFSYTKQRGKYDEGKIVEIITPSPERVTPLCQHFGICGGCAMQHLSSEAQLALKQKTLLEQLKHFGNIQPQKILPPLTGPAWAYRRKARLGVKYVIKKQTVLVGFREKNGRYLADIKRCEILHPSVGPKIHLLQTLINQLKGYNQIPQIEVAIGDEATALIFRHMTPLESSDITQLIAFGQTHNIHIYLQPSKPSSIHCIWPDVKLNRLYYRLPKYQLELGFHPTDFTQINAEINCQMIDQALNLLAPHANDRILDLFCGLGNFTLPIAQQCMEAIGVEGDLELVGRAQENAQRNNISNAYFHQADLTTDFNSANWTQGGFTKILLDPPRSGALEIVQTLSRWNAERIVYVSCNPATLARDAGELAKQGYHLQCAGIIDMFPQTHHVEAMCLFTK